MTPNLPLDDAIPVPFLYSSDRIAQLLGQGVAVLTSASARLETLYDDGVVPFHGRDDLAGKMIELWRDDEARRRLAERGWRIARERTATERVAQYIVEAALNEPFSETYGWPVEPVA